MQAFEAVLGRWIVQRCPDLGDHVALDGKTLRRSRPPARRVRADGAGRDALHRMHDAGESNRKAATERLQVRPEEAIDLLHSRKCET